MLWLITSGEEFSVIKIRCYPNHHPSYSKFFKITPCIYRNCSLKKDTLFSFNLFYVRIIRFSRSSVIWIISFFLFRCLYILLETLVYNCFHLFEKKRSSNINAKQISLEPTLGISLSWKSVATSPWNFILVFENFYCRWVRSHILFYTISDSISNIINWKIYLFSFTIITFNIYTRFQKHYV